MRTLTAGILLALAVTAIGAQDRPAPGLPAETPAQKEARLKWWTDARFGMFIHWGLYALPARHEWVKKYEKTSDADYQKYFDQFNPDLYDPKAWARQALTYGATRSRRGPRWAAFQSVVLVSNRQKPSLCLVVSTM
jgi:alpha-L-fucosidase